MPDQTINVLIVDDDPADAELLSRALGKLDYCDFAIEAAETLELALRQIVEARPDLVFLDCRIPPHTVPSETVTPIRASGYEGPIVIMSGVAQDHLPESERHLGDYPYVCKSDLKPSLLAGLIDDFVLRPSESQ